MAKPAFDKLTPAQQTELRAVAREAADTQIAKTLADEKAAIETALAELKTAKDGTDPEDIRTKTNTLVQASMKLGEAMYAQQAGSGDGASAEAPADDGVVDAEFEDVTGDDDKKSA